MDEPQERTEQPTQRIRERAAREGRVARSAELTAAVVALALLIALVQGGSTLAQALGAMARQSLAVDQRTCDLPASGSLLAPVARALAPALLTAIAAALVLGL